MTWNKKILLILGISACLQTAIFAETVGIFADTTIGQIQFATGDINKALVAKGFTVQWLPLSSLTAGYANKKIVIALATDATVSPILTAQGGTAPTGLGEQAYSLITTTTPQTYWALGGDNNGAMYGGLQIAEYIGLSGLTGVYNAKTSPFMLNRGMKLNLPLDRRIPTYVGGWGSTSAQKAVPNVWDETFWMELFDQQARFRFNVVSVWVHHPFPALVKVPGYDLATLPNVEGYNDGFVKAWPIEQRVAFWKKIMAYAHNRGFKFYFFNWNIYTDYAKDKYPNLNQNQSNQPTIDYMYASMTELLKTYPDLDGFGISAGDGMDIPSSQAAKTTWTWNCIGKAVHDYLAANPSRKFTVIHRALYTSFSTVQSIYKPLHDLPNGTVNYSVKYAMAHMYSTPTPTWASGDIQGVAKAGWKTWLTMRNEDMFYLNWGDPKFVRDFMNGVPNKDAVTGFYIGSDIYNPTRTYFAKDPAINGQLEVKRKWFMEMLWGRLSYDPTESDDNFKAILAARYPTVSSTNLFNAWTLSSRSIPKATEIVQGTWKLDFDWYPEACYSDPSRGTGFRTIGDFAGTVVANGSKLCDISASASNGCGTKQTAYDLADKMQADADAAIALANQMGGTADLNVAVTNIKQLGSLSEYYAYKIRGATFKKAGQTANAQAAMSKAYCWWKTYTGLMDAMYLPDNFRSYSVPKWNFADANALKEYTDLGGTGTPSCPATVGISANSEGKKLNSVMSYKISTTGITLNLSEAGSFTVSLFNTVGKRVISDYSLAGNKGANKVSFSKNLNMGTYLLQVKNGNSFVIRPTKITVLQ